MRFFKKFSYLLLILFSVSCYRGNSILNDPASEDFLAGGENTTPPQKVSIQIATYNLYRLGWAESELKFEQLAENMKNFDLIGVTEVMNQTGTKSPYYGLHRLKFYLEQKTGEPWAFWVSERSAGNSPQYQEYYAYFWKSRKISLERTLGFYAEQNSYQFIREPYGAVFKAGVFDFTLVLSHIIYGEAKWERQYEVRQLDLAYQYFQEKNGAENDVIILGDFNLPASDSAFAKLWNQDEFTYALNPKSCTTCCNSYDNILYSRIYTKEIQGEAKVYPASWISDHRPVYALFEAELDDD